MGRCHSLLIASLLFYAATAVAAQSPCEQLFFKSRKIQGEETTINPLKAKRYIEANDEDLRETLSWMVDSIEVIPRETILHEVLEVFQAMRPTLPAEPSDVAFLVDALGPYNRSGPWITGAIQESFPEFRGSQVFVDHIENKHKLRRLMASNPRLHVIVADDMGYSGAQLMSLVRDLSVNGSMNSRVHVVVSRISSRAATALHPYATVHSKGSIPLVSELVEGIADVPKRQRILAILRALSVHGGLDQEYENKTLTTPSYHLVDEFSFPKFLLDGEVFQLHKHCGAISVRHNEDPNWDSYLCHPFIEAGQPPYRAVTRVELDQ